MALFPVLCIYAGEVLILDSAQVSDWIYTNYLINNIIVDFD